MIGIAPQEGRARSAEQPAVPGATASLQKISSDGKSSVKAAPGLISSGVKNAIPGRLKAGTKQCAKTSDTQSEGVERASGPVAPIAFQDLMACLIPKATHTQTDSRCDGHKTLAPTLQGGKPTGTTRKAEGAPTGPKCDEDGSAAKLGGDAKPMTLEPSETGCVPAGSASLAAGVLASAASKEPAPWSIPTVLNHVTQSSPVSANSDVKIVRAETVPFHSVDDHEVRGDMRRVDESAILSATPGVLEVGISSGTHGWLRVRAEVGVEGQITASLVTQRAGAAEVLNKELPSISAFLASEQVGISHVVVHAAESAAGAQNAATGFGGAASGQHSQREPRTGQLSAPELDPLLSMDALRSLRAREGWNGFGVPAALFASGGGGWLSVRV